MAPLSCTARAHAVIPPGKDGSARSTFHGSSPTLPYPRDAVTPPVPRRGLLAGLVSLTFAAPCVAPGPVDGTRTPKPVLGGPAGWVAKKVHVPAALAAEGLEVFENTKQQYALALPAGWRKKDKAGADALWENPAVKYNNVGVTVNPVRIANIKAFGTLEGVGTKLLDAERAKDSFRGIELVGSTERMCPGGASIYEYEYELFNDYGHKRIVTAVTIANSKLYILNSQYRCGDNPCPVTPEDEASIGLLRAVAATFDVPAK